MSHGPFFGYFETILDIQERLVAEDDEVRATIFSEIHSCVMVSLRCAVRLVIKIIFVGEFGDVSSACSEQSLLPCHSK